MSRHYVKSGVPQESGMPIRFVTKGTIFGFSDRQPEAEKRRFP